MAMLVGHWELRGFGMWAVQELTTADLVGRVGFYYPEGWPDHEIAWALARPFWGRGYATEAASAALGKAFGPLGWPRVVSLIDPANTRSVRLALRLGERFEGEATIRATGWQCTRSRRMTNELVRAAETLRRGQVEVGDRVELRHTTPVEEAR